jgi:hypothetical protein
MNLREHRSEVRDLHDGLDEDAGQKRQVAAEQVGAQADSARVRLR